MYERYKKINPPKIGHTGCRPIGMLPPSPDQSVPPHHVHPEHVPPVQCCAMTFSFICTAILSRSGILRFARANQQRRASSAAAVQRWWSLPIRRRRFGHSLFLLLSLRPIRFCISFSILSNIHIHTYIYIYMLFFFYERRFRFFACSHGTIRRARCWPSMLR